MQMNKDCEALEYLKDYRSIVLAVRIRQRRMARLIKAAAPAQKLTASYEVHEGSYQPQRFEAIDTLEAIAHNKQFIDNGFDRLEQLENALAVLTRDERLFLIMYYMDGLTIGAIANVLNYSSRQSVYNLQQKAVTNFSQIMGYDCVGLDKK